MVYSYNGYYIRLSAERQGFNSLIDRQNYKDSDSKFILLVLVRPWLLVRIQSHV